VSDPTSMREFRHSIANVSWVVFGLVEILAEDQPRSGHMWGLATGSERLRRVVAPIFDEPPETLDDHHVVDAAVAIAEPLALIEASAKGWLAEPALEPAVAQSLTAIVGAARDLRVRFDGWSSCRVATAPR